MPSLLALLAIFAAVSVGATSLRVAVVPACGETAANAGMGNFARALLSSELSRDADLVLLDEERVEQVRRHARCGQSVGPNQNDSALVAHSVGLGRTLAVDRLVVVDVQRAYPDYSVSVRIQEATTGRIVHSEAIQVKARLEQARDPLARLARRACVFLRTQVSTPMVRIPAGRLVMGAESELADERPRHKVLISTFYLDRFEVTRRQLDEFRQSTAATRPQESEHPAWPASEVSWDEAAAYCRWLGKRLPSEAEWEFAARGEAGTMYPWGNDPPDGQRARFASGVPVPVGTRPAGATPLGIHDLAGNVAEWVADWWAPDYYARSPEQDPQGPRTGDYRVVRGGSFRDSSVDLRASARAYRSPRRGSDEIGFRCARDGNP